MLNISQSDFLRLMNFVQKNYGINLSKKKPLIEGRLSNTITDMGFNNFTDYVDHILKGNSSDIEIMLNKLTTNYTYFLREEAHFDFFKDTILPHLVSTKKNQVLSIWSAGCSSGQEPYTISMLIKDYLGSKASLWDTRVLATDISQNALSTAIKGEYDAQAIEDIPDKWKKTYFKKTSNPNIYSVSDNIKSNVIFRTFNLMDPIRFKIKFDVIFCRNVMIYFDQPTKEALVQRFYNATNNGGYLLIGHSETLNKDNTSYKYIMPATYRKI